MQDINNDLDGDYRLIDNLYCSETSTWNGGSGFEPIGDSSNYFTGTFDGQGYTIDGLYIYRPSDSGVGLFGYTDGSTISNVGLTNVDITGGDDYVGALVGYNAGTITNAYSTGGVSGSRYEIGGLVGYNSDPGVIQYSYSTCDLSGPEGSMGGLVGYLSRGYIRDSFAVGSVSGSYSVGGLTGNTLGNNRITNSYWYSGSGASSCYLYWDVNSQSEMVGVDGCTAIHSLDEFKGNSNPLKSSWESQGWDFSDENNYPNFVMGSITPTSYCGDNILNQEEQCDDGNTDNDDGCSSLCKIEIPPSGENKKNKFPYWYDVIFIISGNDWKETTPFHSVTTWKEGDEVMQYPLITYDLDNILSEQEWINDLIIKLNPMLTIILGDDDLELYAPLMINLPTDSHISFWESYTDIVYVEDDEMTAAQGTIYASLINAPLIIEGTALDMDETLEGRNVICIGSVNRICAEQYTTSEIMELADNIIEEMATI